MSDSERALFEALAKAHASAVLRDNPSSVLIKVVADSSGSYTNAMIAALSSLGGKHAPLRQTVEILSAENPVDLAEYLYKKDMKVPGWGSSFKPQPDPAWDAVHYLLQDHYPKLLAKINTVTDYLHKVGKKIYPNPSCYTAATALALSLPPALTPWLLVRARLDGWANIFANHCG